MGVCARSCARACALKQNKNEANRFAFVWDRFRVRSRWASGQHRPKNDPGSPAWGPEAVVSNLSYGLFLGCCRVVCLGLRPAAANVSACDLVTVFVFYRGALSAPMPVFIPSSRVSAGFRRPYLGPLCDLLLVFDGEPLIYIFVDSLNVDLEVYIKT